MAETLKLAFVMFGLRLRLSPFVPRSGLRPELYRMAAILLLTVAGVSWLEAQTSAPAPGEAKGVLDTANTPAAEKAEGGSGAAGTGEAAPVRAPSELVFWNREVVIFRSPTSTLTPEERVEEALERINAASDALLQTSVEAESADIEGEKGYRFQAGEEYLFTLVASDLDELADSGLESARDEVLARMEEIKAARLEQRSAEAIAKGVTYALVATVILVVLLVLLRVLSRSLARNLERRIRRWKRLKFARVDLRVHVATLVEHLTHFFAILVGLYLFCVWVALVFNQFPLTAPLGSAFRDRLREFGMSLLSSAAGAIPGLITVAVILLLARWVARLVDRIIRGLGAADDSAHALMAPDAAKATRRIAAVVIWVFSLVLVYPYLPGSGSDAFKGVSVLLGLMVSLGSAGLVNQVMSGFVMLYSGSVRSGEYAKVGAIEGTVTEMGILAVKILTPQREFITIPNAVMISSPTTNYSRLSEETGVVVKSQVTIGYDVPWRQVHELLTGAARETSEVMETPEPRVLQRALSDWYAEYTLVCYIEKPEHRSAVLSELHGHLQDAFNGAGVQIMSPHYKDQPDEAIVIPKERWFPGGPPVSQE